MALVDHHELTVERLPRIGRRYGLTGHDHQRVSVVIDTRGNRYVSIHATGQPNTAGGDVVVLNEAQASLLSVILAGTFDQAEAAWSSSTAHPLGPTTDPPADPEARPGDPPTRPDFRPQQGGPRWRSQKSATPQQSIH